MAQPRRAAPRKPEPAALSPAADPSPTRKAARPKGLAALLPASVLRGAQQAVADRAAAPSPSKRKRAARPALPAALAAPPVGRVAIVAAGGFVLVDEAGRLPDLRRVPDGGCLVQVALPSGRWGGVAGLAGDAPAGLRWARPADLPVEDRADLASAAPPLLDLVAPAVVDACEILAVGDAARAALARLGDDLAELADLPTATVLRRLADRAEARA